MPAPDSNVAAVAPTAVAPKRPSGPTASGLHGAVLDRINDMIASGDFDVLFHALKGFRNGVVYGTRVRAPHALVLNLVWSKSPYSSMPAKIFKVTKTHALGLGYSAALFAVVRGLLRHMQGTTRVWHNALAGFLIGACFWGDSNNGVHIQMMMYILARLICGLYHLITAKLAISVPSYAYRVYMGGLWSLVILFLSYSPDQLQASMKQSLQYIFEESNKFSNWYDVFVMNSADSLVGGGGSRIAAL
ncbi:putative peroxisomal membrane protein 4 [Leptomonas pyrrhocoris]|uniref:Putative peroxisomal membrane protein 4 n=1 Tax=Leptomonas pyrrhocoris TaxID=157538 RepID=A0A0M9FQS0_LEPPY|nr:putative peroxisomal membrane protein 4 [Leptomonas pyrrhocoris]XP_015652527.1 putative peroxisomal membrane protein 4 [Leptomonas pyrrhocoris]KPA74087.1 putative peroxisomal membrane protein 4 [Leptomonas pyrrhocoris]KPA74088.1 putative peroxisomal membrane protein 4 [Leptomonas pyrrhocoris]|eukprot:XP_015652526.1 putative peroxisomal membrane protein 4 [Leptomonas pyrrhocoris]